MKVYEVLDLTQPGPVIGHHSVWIPPREAHKLHCSCGEAQELGIKVPFQFGGRMQKYKHPHEARYPLLLLQDEYAMLQWLAKRKMAPPVGDWVYFKTVISEHLGAWWADPLGAYGYEMGDAAALPPGNFSRAELQTSGMVCGSPRAWGDLSKPGNVVNGYLIDVHRSGWDRFIWQGQSAELPRYRESSEALLLALLTDGQFPPHERERAYQDFYLDGGWHVGEREVVSRAQRLRFAPAPTETVLDIGSQVGSFLAYATYNTNMAPSSIGIEANPVYIDLARRLARANGWNLCYRAPLPLSDLVAWVRALWPRGVDHLLLLSMVKHFPGGEVELWEIVDALNAGTTYLETNAVKIEGRWHEQHDWRERFPLQEEAVDERAGRYLGNSTDRNTRRLYQVPRRRLTW